MFSVLHSSVIILQVFVTELKVAKIRELTSMSVSPHETFRPAEQIMIKIEAVYSRTKSYQQIPVFVKIRHQ